MYGKDDNVDFSISFVKQQKLSKMLRPFVISETPRLFGFLLIFSLKCYIFNNSNFKSFHIKL